MGSQTGGIHGREREDHMSMAAAVTALIETRTLTPEIIDALNLRPRAVADFNKLPVETQQGMIDVLIDRFSQQLGGSWVH